MVLRGAPFIFLFQPPWSLSKFINGRCLLLGISPTEEPYIWGSYVRTLDTNFSHYFTCQVDLQINCDGALVLQDAVYPWLGHGDFYDLLELFYSL